MGATPTEQSELELLYRYKAAFSLSTSILSPSFLFLPPSTLSAINPASLSVFIPFGHQVLSQYLPGVPGQGKPLSIPGLPSWRVPLEPPLLQSLPSRVGRISRMVSPRCPILILELGNKRRHDSCDHTVLCGPVDLKMGKLSWISWVAPLK